MQRFIQLYSSTVKRASLVCGMLAAAMIVLAVFVICQAVCVRYISGGSSIWQTEFVTYILIASTFLGSPYVLLKKGHVKVGLLSERLHGRRRNFFRIVAGAFTFIVLLVLAATAFQLFHESWSNQWKSESLWGVSMWIPHGGMALGLALLALQGLADLLEQFIGGNEQS